MSEITIYHNPKCSKSRATLGLVEQHGGELKVIEYLRTPPTAKELEALVAKLGIDPEQLVRKGEEIYKTEYAGKKLTRAQWIGLALGFIGVAMVVTHSRAPGLSNTWTLNALWPALAALVGITLGTVYQKRFCPKFDLRTGAVIQFSASLLLTLPIAAATETLHIDWSGQFIFAWLWAVLMLSVTAISVLNILIRRGTAVRVTSLFYLTPAVTALLAWLLFRESLQALALLGMAIAVFGVWLSRR